jgi:polysaccharide export outer membrane protein
MGAVKRPGVYQLPAPKRLLEVLAGAGGVDESAGSVININRPRSEGPIEIDRTVETSGYYTAQVSLPELVEGSHPESNILIKAHDVVTVPRAKLVYVIGEVRRSGGFVLRERENMSVLQAISMAEGLTQTAGSKNAKILRSSADGGPKTEIPVNVRNILAGKAVDIPLRPNDILFVPNSAAKNATLRGIESAIQIGTGVVIWHR